MTEIKEFGYAVRSSLYDIFFVSQFLFKIWWICHLRNRPKTMDSRLRGNDSHFMLGLYRKYQDAMDSRLRGNDSLLERMMSVFMLHWIPACAGMTVLQDSVDTGANCIPRKEFKGDYIYYTTHSVGLF